MAGYKQARANATLDSELGGSRYIALFTVAPTATANGTEVSGGSYARQAATFSAATGGATSNAGVITFPTATGAWGSVVAWAVVDASTGGNQIVYKTITPVTVDTGDVVTFASGAIQVSVS
jgi:hypothetical protein